eukprot:8729881-Pyramimonas_sp.AAC.1
MQGLVTDSGTMSHARHVKPLCEAQLLNVAPMEAGRTLECLCRFQTDNVDVAADVQQDHQHSVHHGPAARSRGQ